jgi:CheY-like chemotaxis protein
MTPNDAVRATNQEKDDGRQPRLRRILVVDDNRDAADALVMLLEIGGHEVRVEYGGKGVLAAAIEFVPDVVFCDIGMPGMSGIDVAKALREDERFMSTTLVAVTGWDAEEDLRRSRHAGFDSHLTKPVDHNSIEKILSDA